MIAASPHADTRGFALLLMVVSLALLGVLSLTAFSVARREYRSAVDLNFALQALEMAEGGLAAVESGAAAASGAPLHVPQVGPSAVTPRSRYRTSIVRLNATLFLLTALGERLAPDGTPLARRQLGVVGKIVPPVDSTPARFQRLASWGWVQMHD